MNSGSESALPEQVAGKDADKEWSALRLVFLDRLWLGLFFVALIAVPVSVSRLVFTGWVPIYGVHVAFMLATVTGFLLRRRLAYMSRAVLLIALIDLTAIGGVVTFGLLGSAWWWILMGGLLSGLLFTARIGFIHTALGILSLVVVAGAFTTGVLAIDFDANEYITRPAAWATMLSGPALFTLCSFWAIGVFFDTAHAQLLELEERQLAKQVLISKLEHSLAEVKTLRGLIPICSHCKKIRGDRGFWESVEAFVARHTDAQFTHGLCPPCGISLYGPVWEEAMRASGKSSDSHDPTF